MDGSDKVTVKPSSGCVTGPNPQFRYVDNSTGTIQPYFDLATQYGFANRMFQTNQGASFPSHLFILSGTSAQRPTARYSPPKTLQEFLPDAPQRGNVVEMIAPNGTYSKMYPCFDHATLIDLLEGANVTWRYYAANSKRS